MNSLFKDILKKLNSLTICQVTSGIIVFLVVGYLVYEAYEYSKNGNINKMNKNTKEHFDNGEKFDEYYGNNPDAVLVTFYSFDYCGYCKKFKPIWDEAQTKEYPLKVKFRYVISNTLSPEEKSAIPYYVESKHAPNVILTYNGKNVKEFDQQMNKPLRGLDEFVSSKGEKNSNANSKHL